MSSTVTRIKHPFVEKREASPVSLTRLAELEYLSDLLPQMRRMAISLREPTLAYLLELAMAEAKLQMELELESSELER